MQYPNVLKWKRENRKIPIRSATPIIRTNQSGCRYRSKSKLVLYLVAPKLEANRVEYDIPIILAIDRVAYEVCNEVEVCLFRIRL